jgi:serine protease
LAHADRLIIDFQDGLSLSDAQAIAQTNIEWVHPNAEDEALSFIDTDNADLLIKKLASHPQIEAIEPSLTYQAYGESSDKANDPLYSQQWNMRLIGAEEGWKQGGGQGIIVAVIDTGVAPVKDIGSSRLLDGISFVTDESSWHDANGHGTHVAGTIAQTTNNSYGAVGVAPNVEILPIKALSKYGSGQSEWIASAIDEAVDRGADIINMSLGGSPSKVIEVAVQKALKSGVLVVAAAGNTGKEGVSSPASIQGVVAVSATGPKDELAPYSTFGQEISLSAPGGDKSQTGGGIIQETIRNSDSAFLDFQGTSMAAPHVSGAAAVLMGAGAGTAENVRELLFESAEDLGAKGWDKKYGHGRLDVSAALQSLNQYEHGTRAFFSVFLALVIGSAARQKFGKIALMAMAGFTAAGGFFFWPALGSASRPLLSLFSNFFWQSALIWSLLSIALLPFKNLRWIGVGCCIGVLCHLGGGLLDQQLNAPFSGLFWFPLNGLILLLPISLAIVVGRYMKEDR